MAFLDRRLSRLDRLRRAASAGNANKTSPNTGTSGATLMPAEAWYRAFREHFRYLLAPKLLSPLKPPNSSRPSSCNGRLRERRKHQRRGRQGRGYKSRVRQTRNCSY